MSHTQMHTRTPLLPPPKRLASLALMRAKSILLLLHQSHSGSSPAAFQKCFKAMAPSLASFVGFFVLLLLPFFGLSSCYQYATAGMPQLESTGAAGRTETSMHWISKMCPKAEARTSVYPHWLHPAILPPFQRPIFRCQKELFPHPVLALSYQADVLFCFFI